ncbi:MAG: hypothetical protein AABX47_09005 [Nanoarchaeota archaeon]
MKIWLAYKFRGSSLDTLRPQLEEIVSLLENDGHKVFTMIKNIQNWNPDPSVMSKSEAVRRAYCLCGECDIGLCVYPSADPSEGRGWDAGYLAGMGKPTVMAIHTSLSIPYTEALFLENPANLRHNIPPIIRYDTFHDIARSLRSGTED